MTYIEIFISLILLIIPIGLILIMWQELSTPTPFYIKQRLLSIQFDILWLRYKLHRLCKAKCGS